MCGIVGYFSSKPSLEDSIILRRLYEESSIRGIHSFGIADSYGVTKYLQNEFNEVTPKLTSPIIFHNRYSTSGDYKDHNNNQPIEYKDSYFAFNGVISMKDKKGMEEEYNVSLTTENDGELLLQLTEGNPEDIVNYINSNNVSCAGLMIKEGRLYAFRNKNRPSWVTTINDSVFITSTKDIMKRVIPDSNPEELKPNKLYVW